MEKKREHSDTKKPMETIEYIFLKDWEKSTAVCIGVLNMLGIRHVLVNVSLSQCVPHRERQISTSQSPCRGRAAISLYLLN